MCKYGGGGDSLIKVDMDVRARALAFRNVNFARALNFWGKFCLAKAFCTHRTSVPTFIREYPPPQLNNGLQKSINM